MASKYIKHVSQHESQALPRQVMYKPSAGICCCCCSVVVTITATATTADVVVVTATAAVSASVYTATTVAATVVARCFACACLPAWLTDCVSIYPVVPLVCDAVSLSCI